MRTFTLTLAVLAFVACNKDKDVGPATAGDSGTTVGDDDDDTTGVGDDDDTTVGDDDDDTPDGIRFDAHIVGEALGARYAAVGDLDGDGIDEIVVSAWNDITKADIPYGWVQIWSYGGDLDTWNRVDALGTNALIRSPNQPALGDIDNDGDLDIVVGFGSRYCEVIPAIGQCGGLVVLENDNGTWNRYVQVENSLFYYRGIDLADIDGDGNLDVVTVSERYTFQEREAFVQLLSGTGTPNFSPPVQIGQGLGPFPSIVDVDGDGDLDVMGGEQGTGESFSWLENDGGDFTKHLIFDNLGNGNMIRLIPDLYGDGVTRGLASNHTNTETPKKANPDIYDSQLVAFEIPSDATQEWLSYDVLSEGILPTPDLGLFPNDAPGTFDVGDADGDGDNDILLAGDGDPTVYLLDQVAPGDFVTRVLRNNVYGNGGTWMTDFTGDGAVEFVVTSYGSDQVFVIERVAN